MERKPADLVVQHALRVPAGGQSYSQQECSVISRPVINEPSTALQPAVTLTLGLMWLYMYGRVVLGRYAQLVIHYAVTC